MSTNSSDLTSCSKVFALPEICERISYSIDNKTITSCLRVNREWNASWLPILWHTIDAGHQWHNPAFVNALGEHGDLVRILKCTRYDDISPLLRTDKTICRNLVTIVLPKTTLVNQSDHIQLLRQNPHIRDLSLGLHDDNASLYTELVNAVGELRNLRRLALDENKILDVNTLETILSKCNGSLRELSLKGTYFIKHPFGSGNGFASGFLACSKSESQLGTELITNDVEIDSKETFGIMSLCLEGVVCTQDLILNLASRFPLLSHLSLKGSMEVYFSKNFPERLAKRCPKIKNIDISSTEDIDDDTIASLVGSFPGLQTFRASETRFGNESFSTLVEHCRDLTVLEINSTCQIQGQVIQQLFEKCWALRSLDAWDVSANVVEMMMEVYGGGKTVGATDAKNRVTVDGSITQTESSLKNIRGQWVCRGIERLVLRFDYDPSELSEESEQLYPASRARRFIYEQLSKLTKLKYLAIGGTLSTTWQMCGRGDETDEKDNSTLDDQPTFDISDDIWIDFSLRSGLFLLSPLKELRTLCLSAMDHAIGLPEIIWISENWPNLKSIEGLYEDDDEDVVNWLRENRPDIEIRNEDDGY
ncbi:hypothetical protein BGZ80_008010 [Entomortierella chlamydospora]|uniref:Uncharacterized protein n=1 Tax=Entomortierella chlamydospora TaxID=101097 RepID=A0A9P6T1G8_9FUNG|nr:hypothetical protein BGZ80_008010 [Entomortierella chlamydospora]